MRILIATVAASVLAAAAAAGVALHSVPAKSSAPGPAIERATAGLVWHSGSVALRLTDRPCPFEELSVQLETEGVSPARAYVVQQGKHRTTGCWSQDLGGDVVTMEPGRELGQIPIAWFRTEPGA
jgi:hypothetical protein